MTPRGLARKIAVLPVEAPIYESFNRSWMRRRESSEERSLGDERSVWYDTQKEHWLGWLSEYDSPGGYGRKIIRGRTAEFAYNHIVNPGMLLWLAEAAGVPRKVVLLARREALAATTMMSMSAAVRAVIPYLMVEAFLKSARTASRR